MIAIDCTIVPLSPSALAAAKVFPVLVSDLNLALSAKELWVLSATPRSTLDAGASKVIVDFPQNDMSVLEDLPRDRLGIRVSSFNHDMLTKLCSLVSLIVADSCSADSLALLDSMAAKDPSLSIVSSTISSDTPHIKHLVQASQLSLGPAPGSIDIVHALTSKLVSDRPDGLFPTIVTDTQGIALGLCYSSYESILKALTTGQGVYYSRNRGIWHKGLTSGATQQLIRIDWDCDADTLRFTVIQTHPGFCHLSTRTCFGPDSGISNLAATLTHRRLHAPAGSYTKRIFDDPALLHAKILEEAQELCDATAHDDIAWEAADLIYFAMAKCIASGVSLSDVERQLDAKSKKISRRPGDAKCKFADMVASNKENIPNSVSEKTLEPTPKELLPFTMQVYKGKLSAQLSNRLIQRPIINTDEIMARVRPIVAQVRAQGDAALVELTAKFDKAQLSIDNLLERSPFDPAKMIIDANVKASIDLAFENIWKFHQAQMDNEPLVVETMPGVVCSRIARPIERVGLYVPGGTAVLPSSTLMLAIPAKVAGCSEIVIATPPRKDGTISPEIMYVAAKVGATAVLKVGGAQAIAAMAFGTATVPKVDKICGPGNQYVTAAKMIAQSDSSALLSIDMPAGPSELLVIADACSDPRYVVSDLLSQAEHGADSQVVLVAIGFKQNHLDALQQELRRQAMVLPRADVVKLALEKSYILMVDTMDEALAFSNEYAPEHLILNVDHARNLVDRIKSAGSVFLGAYSPESCGDYASGTNHTLPTYGYARMYSGVNTHTFLKHITTQELTKEGLDRLGDCVMTLAALEQLEAHRNAVAIRLMDIRRK
ncbi:hypothetical protein BDV3_005452 [Batrachochytrium dendrobatidis]